MEKVVIKEDVTDYLNSLTDILFKKEYFGFELDALNYIDKIYDFINNQLPYIKAKETPKRLIKYGENYVMYKTNKRTSWYVFFSRKGSNYLVKYITNNHVAKAAFLNGL